MVSMIDTPTSGEIIFNGMKPQMLNSEELAYFRRRQLGFVFQDFNLLPTLSVEENIILPLTLDEQPISVMEERLQFLSEKLDLTAISCPHMGQIISPVFNSSLYCSFLEYGIGVCLQFIP